MKLAEEYKKSLSEKWSIRLRTRHPDGDNYDGVVTQIKRGFVALREERELDFDGIIILAKEFIKGSRDGKYERAINAILRENNAIRKIRSPRWLDGCETLSDITTQLMRRDIWPGVEIVYNIYTESAFYIGPITRTADDHFFLKHYDADGKWDKEYRIEYDLVFKIELDSNYINRFNMYMRKHGGA